MNTIKKTIVICVSVCWFLQFGRIIGHAQNINFDIQPVLPANQTEGVFGYFDLTLAPKEQQTLEIKLSNSKDYPIKVASELHQATTNSNGVVEYGASVDKVNDTAPARFEKLVRSEQTKFDIPAKSSVMYTMQVTMPAYEYQGIVLGGVTFYEVGGEEDVANKDNKVAITNSFQYQIAIVLRGQLDLNQADLTLKSVEAGLFNHHNNILVNLENMDAQFINQLEVSMRVTHQENAKIHYVSRRKEMQVAPNTTLKIGLPLEDDRFIPGEYLVEIKAKSGEQKWNFRRKLIITKKTADKINAASVDLPPKRPVSFYLGIAVILMASIFLLVVGRLELKKRNHRLAKTG